MIKLILALCAIVSLASAASSGYIARTTFLNGTNCQGTSGIVEVKYYQTGRCALGYIIAYDTTNPTQLTISTYNNNACSGTPYTYTDNMNTCILGNNPDQYYWSYYPSMNKSVLNPTYPTFTIYGDATTTGGCTADISYVLQSYPTCSYNQNIPYIKTCTGSTLYNKQCPAANRTETPVATCSCATPVGQPQNANCNKDGDNYSVTNTCGPSTFTPSGTSGGATTTTSPNGVTTTQSPNGVTTTTKSPSSGNSSDSSVLSVSLALLIASLAAFLL